MDMSEKNADHNGTQWTKATATAAAAVIAAHQQQQQKHNTGSLSGAQQFHNQLQQRLYDPTTLMPAHNSIFGGAGVTASLGHPAHPDGIAAYAGARFHPPPLPNQQSTIDATNLSHTITAHQHTQHHLQQHQAPPTHAPTKVLTAPAASSPSVPVQSGFVPPPLLSGAAAAVAAAATSVLTPNPFAVTPQLEHLTSHLNLQQQFELNKIMNAISTHPNSTSTVGGGGVGVGTASGGGNSASSLISQQAATQRLITTDASMTGAAGSNISNSSGGSGSGVISSTIAENVFNALGATPNNSVSASVPAVHGRLAGMGVRLPDDDRLNNLQKVVESGISESAKEQIQQIVDRISILKPVEKLLLYLRLPGETPETDPLRHPQNPLGTRSEINHTINWVRTHLEHDPKVSIPKQDVYNDYIAYCDRLDIKPLSTADFGKVMKQVFPGVRPRRLGTRGHSRYCYAAMRKTTKLDTPQLPLLDTTTANESMPLISCSDNSSAGDADTETWKVIRNWAENILNMKVDSVQDLVTRIKGTTGGGSEATSNMRAGAITTPHKKYTPREPKEKRLMVDMGPLKKRRKKRRKGSSSSESSCCQPQLPPQPASSTQPDTLAVDVKPNLNVELVQIKQELLESPTMQRVQHLPATTTQVPQVSTVADSFLQRQQQLQMLPMNLVTEQRTVLARAPPAASAFGVVHPQPSTTQQRTSRTTSSGVSTPTTTTAVKNLTPKIIELSAAASPTRAGIESAPTIKEEEFLDEYNPNIFCKKVRKAQQTKGFWANSPTSLPTNIVVPTITTTTAANEVSVSATSAVATSVIATTHASVSHLDTSAAGASDLMGPPAQIGSSTSVSPSSGLLGTESSSSTTSNQPQPTAASPKVLSRNMLQMRARRQQIAAALAAEAAANASNSLSDPDAGDLPANLGLPRERVISICNMDKHELDDYFVDGEVEEEPEDQDTELLQYFQTRDAEEKLNTSDAIKISRHSTASTTSLQMQATVATAPSSTTTTSSTTTSTTLVPAAKTVSFAGQSLVQITAKEAGSRPQQPAQVVATDSYYAPQVLNGGGFTIAAGAMKQIAMGVSAPKTITTTTTAVGSASASLTLMSQKHQQAQQQNAHQQQQLIHAQMRKTGNTNTNNNNKRKITLSGTTLNTAEVIATRKNCIFFPISPNGSNTTGSVSSCDNNNKRNKNSTLNKGQKCKKDNTATTTTGSVGGGGGSFFVSPGQSVHRVRPKPAYALTKQMSLDQDCSDPMIGASRRRRSYANLVTPGGGNSIMPLTSASAPPSPSVLQQQQQKQQYQQMYGTSFLSGGTNMGQQTINPAPPNANTYNQSNNNSAIISADLLAADQNSLDLDMFSAAAARAMEYDELALNELTTPLTEMQRSQSVPLSQLQRVHSPAFNRSFQAAPYSACTSVAQTPVPHEYADSTALFSENSCSQTSGGLNSKRNTQIVASKLLDEEAALLATDTAAILDNLDVGEMFTAEFLRMKFPNNAQGHNTITATTCSSAGSSSGYSSSACTTFGSSALISGGGSNSLFGGIGNTMSRSVPSTPLPHQQQQSPFSSYFYGGRRRLEEDSHVSPSLTMSGTAAMGGTFTTTVFKYNNHSLGGTIGVGGGNNSYDISRSMPTTPTATPRFRYSPTEFTRDFLSNGNTNTIDSLISGGANTNSLTDAGAPSEGLGDVLTGLTGNNDALIDDSCCLSADDFGNHTPITDAESIIAEANELLGSL